MGEAKRRGTYEQRKRKAIESKVVTNRELAKSCLAVESAGGHKVTARMATLLSIASVLDSTTHLVKEPCN